jgi:hypothetical protein
VKGGNHLIGKFNLRIIKSNCGRNKKVNYKDKRKWSAGRDIRNVKWKDDGDITFDV